MLTARTSVLFVDGQNVSALKCQSSSAHSRPKKWVWPVGRTDGWTGRWITHWHYQRRNRPKPTNGPKIDTTYRAQGLGVRNSNSCNSFRYFTFTSRPLSHVLFPSACLWLQVSSLTVALCRWKMENGVLSAWSVLKSRNSGVPFKSH